MNSNDLGGKIFFFKTDKTPNPKDFFTQILEVNSNFDNLKSLSLTNGKAYGITVNNELLEWEFEKKKANKNIPAPLPQENSENNSTSYTPSKTQNKKNDFYFLLSKPSYRFHKLKIKSVSINKTMCLSLDTNGNVLVWGQSKDGLLGLGYEVNTVENPTILEGLVDIVDISLSDYHAVALNSSGIPFSWGLGKYGELGLERSIYSPVPQQMNTEGLYSKVFCGNLITCFLDFDGHFSYFGVIIRQLGGNSSTVTTKNLLNDQNIDSKSIFLEKEFEELEDQKFKEIVIGNGFIGLLGTTGTLFTLEYNDKLTMLYSKYYLYNIVVVKNGIYGLAKDNVKIVENKNNLNENKLINSTSEEKIKTNYYLCRWCSKSSSENEVCSDIWVTTIWKFKDDFTNIIENCKLLDTNDSRNILLLLDTDEKYSNNLNTSVLNPNKKLLDLSANNDFSQLEISMNNNTTITENIMMFNLNRKKLPEKFLDYEAEFDDSFNLKYKRTKVKSKSILKDLPNIGTIRSRSVSRILNKSYNTSFQNLGYGLNKSNFINFGNNNISAIGPNTSGLLNKKNVLIPTSNNYKKPNDKIFTNNLHNYKNLSNPSNNKNKQNSYTQNSKGNLSLNNNDFSKDNNDLDNNLSQNEFNANSNYKSNQKEKENDNVNIYEESIDVKERELNKYRSEIDDIIANYKNKQNIKKNNLMNKYGLSRENNINLTNKKNKRENEANYIDNQNLSRDNIIDFNIRDQIENSKSKNEYDESPYRSDLNKRYDAQNLFKNDNKNTNEKNSSLFKDIYQSSNKKGYKNNKEIMENIQHYFANNKVNPQKRNKKKNIKRNKSENEIEFDINRQETFQNVNNVDNNRGQYNSLIINNPLNLYISNSEFSEFVPTKCLSEGNDILNNNSENENEDIYNNKKDKIKYNHSNRTDKNEKNGYNEHLISTPVFNNDDNERNRLSNLIKNGSNNNKDFTNENIGINFQGNTKNKEIKNKKNNNILSPKNSNFSLSNNQNIKSTNPKNINKINSNNENQGKSKNNLVAQNINNINLNYSKKPNDIKNNINSDSTKKNYENKNEINNNYKEVKDIKQNKYKIPKNTNNKKFNNANDNTDNNKEKEITSNNNIKFTQSQKNNLKEDKNNSKKIPSNINNYQKNINNSSANNKDNQNTKGKINILSPEEVFLSNNNQLNKANTKSKSSKENNYYYKSDKNKNNINDNNKDANNNNYIKQNIENYNLDDINKEKNVNYKEREPDLNNCDFDVNEINDDEYENENNNKNKKNNEIYKKFNKINYQKENIYSYKFGDNNKKTNNNNNLNIENIKNNNINYFNDSKNNRKNQINKIPINKHNITYFCFLVSNYMKKKSYAMCVYEIANFQKKYEKNLSLKLLFMVIKKRIIFYKIKFFHRYKKIYKYLVKYKKTNNVKSGESNQRKNQFNIKGYKK